MDDNAQQPPIQDEDEPIIKDPIYDIMDDDEAQEAFDRLMELADEKNQQTEGNDSLDESK